MSDTCNKQNIFLEENGIIRLSDDYIYLNANGYNPNAIFYEIQKEHNKRADKINKLQELTSHLVNILYEQDKRISSLLAYQKLSDWNTCNSFIITIQKLWRGYFVRKTIKMMILELKQHLSSLCK